MPSRVVLIDYENNQLTADWDLLAKQECIVRVFLGFNQNKAPIEMVEALQPLGKAVEYVRCQHTGKNALDFLLAFHLGQLAAAHRDAQFWIVSKDRGFDSLAKHLGEVHISCARVVTVAETFIGEGAPLNAETCLQKAIDHLGKLKAARPRSSRTLRSTLRNLFKGIDESAIETLVRRLQANQILTESGGKILYT